VGDHAEELILVTKPHPIFEKAITYSGIKVGLTFLVWDTAKAEVVATGIITRAMFMDSDDRRSEVEFTDEKGVIHEFDLADYGVTYGEHPDHWSRLITVPGSYIEKLDELPRVPRARS